MFFILRFRSDAFVEDGIFHLIVCILFAEEFFAINQQTNDDTDGKGIARSPGNQYSTHASGNAQVIERPRFQNTDPDRNKTLHEECQR